MLSVECSLNSEAYESSTQSDRVVRGSRHIRYAICLPSIATALGNDRASDVKLWPDRKVDSSTSATPGSGATHSDQFLLHFRLGCCSTEVMKATRLASEDQSHEVSGAENEQMADSAASGQKVWAA